MVLRTPVLTLPGAPLPDGFFTSAVAPEWPLGVELGAIRADHEHRSKLGGLEEVTFAMLRHGRHDVEYLIFEMESDGRGSDRDYLVRVDRERGAGLDRVPTSVA